LECSLCRTRYAIDRELPYCEDCWSIMESGGIPPVNFREYFSDGYEDKLTAVDSLLFNSPDHFFLWYLKGHLEHELGSIKRALRSINTSISYKEDFGDAWIRLGLIYSDMHRDTEAIENFERGLKYPLIDPTNLVDAGSSLLASGNPRLSAKVLLRAMDLVPDDERTLLTLGKVLIQLDEMEDARALLVRGLEQSPHNEEILRTMAQLLLKEGDLERAMEMYERVLDQHPRDFEALLAMGEIQLKRGEMGSSIKYYKAVRDLDLHITWSGVLRFILGNIRELLTRNRNMVSYRDSLKREFENTSIFLRDLEKKVEGTAGPEVLEDLEGLMRTFDNLRNNLKEQLKQFTELLSTYKVEDSFHQHLEAKVHLLTQCLEQKRLFDAKELSLELTPFLAGLKGVDPSQLKKMRSSVNTKMEEMSHFGLDVARFQERFMEVERFEKEGNSEAALFLLKEIEVTLDEHWLELGRAFHEKRSAEMKAVLDDSRGKFDTTELTRRAEEFGNLSGGSPKELRKKDQEFTSAYEKESSSYFQREGDRVLQEVKYKLLLLEKEGASVSELMVRMKDIKERRTRLSSQAFFNETSRLLEELETMEKTHSFNQVRERLDRIKVLMDDLELAGLKDDMGPNIEPVKRVIEKSIDGGNVRLADILSNELFDNVDKVLFQSYLGTLRARVQESEGRVLRLKGLGVERTRFNDLLKKSKDSMSSAAIGQMLIALGDVARIARELDNFQEESLPGEVQTKVKECKALIDECAIYDIEMIKEARLLERIERPKSNRSYLDQLEDAFQLEMEIERKIKDELRDRIADMNESSRNLSNELTSKGADPRKMMEIMSLLNRSEMLLEGNQVRLAFEASRQANEALDKVGRQTVRTGLKKKLESVSEMFSQASKLEIDMEKLEEEYRELPKLTPDNTQELKGPVESLFDRTRYLFFDGAERLNELVKTSYESLVKVGRDALTPEFHEMHVDNMRSIREALNRGDVTALPPLFNKAGEILQDGRSKVHARGLMTRCSELMGIGFDSNDERASTVMARVQDIARRVQKGELEGIEEELEDLEAVAESMMSVLHLSKIEQLLKELSDLDDLTVEVFGYVNDDLYAERKRRIEDEVMGLMDTTSSIYDGQDQGQVGSMLKRVTALREEVISLDSEWRASRKIDLVKEVRSMRPSPLDRSLSREMDKLIESYNEKDWKRFHSIYDRVEGKLKNIDWKGRPQAALATVVQPPASTSLSSSRTISGAYRLKVRLMLITVCLSVSSLLVS